MVGLFRMYCSNVHKFVVTKESSLQKRLSQKRKLPFYYY
uniref:Bm680 n=1 Tax=Brugia malayi TaxID=6279 RepID=A0A1I9G4R4_BRUMA|nr:Bm680 [Brugia malayi]